MEESRERVIHELKEHCAYGNLTLAEYESRLNVATNADSRSELLPLIENLPELLETRPEPANENRISTRINRGSVKEHGSIFGLFTGITRKGVWQPPRYLSVAAMFSGVTLDFRQAEMAPGVTEVDVFCLLGGVDVKVKR